MFKINRNTINLDIAYCYSQLQKNNDRIYIEDRINKILYRLEIERIRIMEKLDM